MLDETLELQRIQELVSKAHEDLLEINKRFLELSVRINNLRESLDKNR